MIACDGARCTVQGPVNLENAVALLARGNELFTAPQVTLDLAAVTGVDSSALSLLLEWRREATRNAARQGASRTQAAHSAPRRSALC